MIDTILQSAEECWKENEDKLIDIICFYHQLADQHMNLKDLREVLSGKKPEWEGIARFIEYALDLMDDSGFYIDLKEALFSRLLATPLENTARYIRYIHIIGLNGLFRNQKGYVITSQILSSVPEARFESVWRKVGSKLYNTSPENVLPEDVWRRQKKSFFQEEIEEYLDEEEGEANTAKDPKNKEDEYAELLKELDAIRINEEDELMETYQVIMRSITKEQFALVKPKFPNHELHVITLWVEPENRRRLLDFEETLQARIEFAKGCLGSGFEAKRTDNQKNKLLMRFFQEYNRIKLSE